MPKPYPGAHHRMASPAQMERLRALLKRPVPGPMTLFTWRQWIRSYRNPASNGETERAAWAHLDRRNKANIAKFVERFRAMREDALARDTLPGEPKM